MSMNIAMAPEDKKFLKLLAVQRGCTAADLITECVHGLAASNRDVAVLAGVACAPGACVPAGTADADAYGAHTDGGEDEAV